MKFKHQIPNAITLLNLCLGFGAILLNDSQISPLLILAAAVVDLFDGLSARALGVSSELGVQLDSLSDLVSFGVAPAYLYYQHILEPSTLEMVAVTTLPVCAAIRLAIFNVRQGKEINFQGLPSPAAGLFVAFLVYGGLIIHWTTLHVVHLLVPVLVAALMVIPVTMLSLKGFGKRIRREKVAMLVIGILCIALLGVLGFAGIPWAILIYIVGSWVNEGIKRLSGSI